MKQVVEADPTSVPTTPPAAPATAAESTTPIPNPVEAASTDALPTPDRAVLARMEEENKRIESDAKCPSLTIVHSRKNSDTSLISVASASSSNQETDSSKNSGGSGVPETSGEGTSEEELWAHWARVIANWEGEWKKHNQLLRDMVRSGVPCHFRGIVWQLLAGAYNSPEKKQYVSYIKAKSACEKVIRRDIARTYPDHDFFKEKDGLGQESLFNVMKAYSLHDREVGYCQGSGFIVGLLLMQMPEEEAFAVLVKIMQQHRMRDMFKPSMAELGLCVFQLENLVQELLPEIHMHFQTQNFSTSIYASSWFLTLFTTSLSLKLACRVMDVFLLDGIETVFKVAIALLSLGKEDLLVLDMDNLLKYIQKKLPLKAEEDHDAFMALVYSVKYNPKKMKKLEKEYSAIKTKEQGDIAVQRCLRQENRLLKQRVELLERESSALAERLVRGQVDRAEGEEESFALGRELSALRRAHRDAQQRLALAHDEIRSLEMTIAERNNSVESSLEGSEESEMVAGGARGEELARCLQRELVRARLHAAEREAAERELTARIGELENENKTLRRQRVDNNVAHLQDELIAVKMREAEANLSLKDLRQRVAELSDMWQKHLQEHKTEGPPPAPVQSTVVSDIMATPKKLLRAWEGRSADVIKLEEELISARVREVEALTELKELRLKVMEQETQVQVSTNQLRRQDDEARAAREQLDSAAGRERALNARLRDLQRRCDDLESKAKYESMQANIRGVEAAQRIAELENFVSELRLQNEVMATEGELRGNIADDSEKVRELQEQMAELKAEVMRLQAWRARSLGNKNPVGSVDLEDEALEEEGNLRLWYRRPSSQSTCSLDATGTTLPKTA